MTSFTLLWGIPFIGLLLSVGVGQTLVPRWWERFHPLVSLGWSVAVIVPWLFLAPITTVGRALAQTLWGDYLPFVASLLALYTLAGGIRIRTHMSGHPRENAILLAFGVVLAGVIGTPGATLLILPVMLTSNQWRRHRAHTLVFLIFLVANIGGGLTPLGPPLLMGMLQGVPFLWTVKAMLPPTALLTAVLLAVYLILDGLFFYPHEDPVAWAEHREEHDDIGIEGTTNLLLLALVIAVQAACASWQSPWAGVVRLGALLLLAALALRPSTKAQRLANDFHWHPMQEVASVFAAIFVTLIPLLAMLSEGDHGPFAGALNLLSTAEGQPRNWAYFGLTGLLSGFLDNAPTFLLFFKAAGGGIASLTTARATTLTAISAGAVFCGGLSYLGNAPNFMVRGVAEARGVAMPHFFAFIGWALMLLVPALLLVGWAFFV